ncbi:MAG: GspE/PulE family protein [Candidatus Paceibacterota bacterium]
MTTVQQGLNGLDAENFVNSVFASAIAEKASDVHFDRRKDEMVIRFRVDGTLSERYAIQQPDIDQIVNNVKVIASLDITTHEVPQDGSVELFEVVDDVPSEVETPGYGNNEGGQTQRVVDVRVSVFPSIYGEVIVARILNRQSALKSLHDLGLNDGGLAVVERIISRDYGMVLIAGPVGSGKTTTLYSFMQEMKSEEKNIMTIEDPVEFHLGWLRQSELRPHHGFDFESALGSILRQDPDVIMIGELRNKASAERAISLSLIGRIVGATIHANSTIGTIARLADMGIERNMVAYALNGVIAQRLVREVCPSCKESYVPAPELMEYFKVSHETHQFVRGAGCAECNQSGYRGRVGIFEVLEFDNTIRSGIVAGESMSRLEEIARKAGMKTLRDNALEKVFEGVTTLEEVGRIV